VGRQQEYDPPLFCPDVTFKRTREGRIMERHGHSIVSYCSIIATLSFSGSQNDFQTKSAGVTNTTHCKMLSLHAHGDYRKQGCYLLESLRNRNGPPVLSASNQSHSSDLIIKRFITPQPFCLQSHSAWTTPTVVPRSSSYIIITGPKIHALGVVKCRNRTFAFMLELQRN
jgi:hypothetical protein